MSKGRRQEGDKEGGREGGRGCREECGREIGWVADGPVYGRHLELYCFTMSAMRWAERWPKCR